MAAANLKEAVGGVSLAEPEGGVLRYVHVGGLHHPLIDPADRKTQQLVCLEPSAKGATASRSVESGCISAAFQPHQTLRRGPASVSPVAVDVQDDVRGADGHGHLVPLVVGQAVGEHLGVGLLASGAVVEAHLAALAAALQLQEPGGKERL